MKVFELIFILILFGSCNVSKLCDPYAEKRLKRGNLEHIILDTEEYVFSYWDSGASNKPVYVLFHGFGSSTHLQWFKQAKTLTKTHRLILPNLLHFGSISKGEEKYSIQDQVDAMATLLEALNIDSMVLGGTSYGGLVAVELARQEKYKIEKLTIFSSPVKFFNNDDLSMILAKEAINDISEILVPADLTMMREFTNILLFKDKKVPKFLLKDMYKTLFKNEKSNLDYKLLLYEMQKNMAYNKNFNYEFDYPVLLIWGVHDELISARIGKQLKSYIPSSELYLIQKAGHIPNIEQKKDFNKILTTFLRK